MVLPPKHVYSAIVKNASNANAVLKVIYNMPDGSQREETKTVSANQEANLQEQIVEDGSAKFIGHISHVAIDGEAHEESFLAAPFLNVNSPVRNYNIEIHPRGEGLKLVAKP